MAPLIGSRKVARIILVSFLLALFLAAGGGIARGQMTRETLAANRAISLWNQRHWEQAVLAYEDYLRIYPDGALAPQAYLNLGMYLEHHKRLEEALNYYQAGLARAKGKIAQVLQTDIADVQQKFGNHDEAVRIYQGIMRQPASWEMFKIANKKLLVLHYHKALREKLGKRANRCGEGSLRLVLRELGIPPKEAVLQRFSPQTGSRTSMVSLKQAAQAHGLESYGLKVADGRLETLTVPAILLFHPGHFAVFQGISPQGVKISEAGPPSTQETVIPLAQFQKEWTGYALCFAPKATETRGLSRLSDREMKNLRGGSHQPGDLFQSNKGTDTGNDPIDPPNILVNSFSLNLIIEDLDGVWKGMGPPVLLKRTYNSEDANSGMFGHSWHFQYEIYLAEDASGNVTLTRGDARADLFTPKGDGTYTPPKRVFDRLVKNADGTFNLWVKKLRSTYYFGPDLHLSKIVDKNGNALDFAWGANGLTAITIHYASATKTISFQYGNQGKCTRVTLPDGRAAAFTYRADGTLLTSTNPEGYQASYTYDTNNYITAITTPYGSTQVAYQHSPGNYNIYAPQKITDSLGGISQFALVDVDIVYTDANGHPTRYTADGVTGFTGTITDAAGSATTYTYDSYGNRISVSDPKGAVWTLTYGADPSQGNLTQVTDPLGKSVTLTYTGDDLSAVDAPLGQHTGFTYDANHNLAKIVDALSRETTFTYNTSGKPTQIKLPGNPNPIITYQYDAYGNLISETDPTGHTTSYAYDGAGRLNSRTDAKGQTAKFAYDQLDRLTGVSQPDGTVLYTYDFAALREVTDKDRRKLTYAYDKLGRLVNFKDINGFLLHYTYDAVGNLASLTYPGNKVVAYTYDVANRLSSLTDWLGNTTTYAYDKAGNPVQVAYPNGTGAQMYYDQNQRLICHQNYGVPGQPLPRFAYLLDDLGNRIGETRRSVDFAEPGVQNVLSQYDLDDRLVNAGSTMFQYDANGNTVQKAAGGTVANYAYDPNNMLTKVQTPNQAYQYQYDPMRNRVGRQAGADKRLLVVNPNPMLSQSIMQTTVGKVPTDYYIYGHGLVYRLDAADNAFYYHYDGLGNTVVITDKTGNPVNYYSYDPFGKLLSSYETFPNPFRYVGRYGVMDETNGMMYMRARYYDSEIGRFINKDPLGLAGGFNLFTYVLNNPLKNIDPNGKFIVAAPIIYIMLVAAISGYLLQFPLFKDRARKLGRESEGAPGPGEESVTIDPPSEQIAEPWFYL